MLQFCNAAGSCQTCGIIRNSLGSGISTRKWLRQSTHFFWASRQYLPSSLLWIFCSDLRSCYQSRKAISADLLRRPAHPPRMSLIFVGRACLPMFIHFYKSYDDSKNEGSWDRTIGSHDAWQNSVAFPSMPHHELHMFDDELWGKVSSLLFQRHWCSLSPCKEIRHRHQHISISEPSFAGFFEEFWTCHLRVSTRWGCFNTYKQLWPLRILGTNGGDQWQALMATCPRLPMQS